MATKIQVNTDSYGAAHESNDIAAIFRRYGFEADVRATISAFAPEGDFEMTTMTIVAISGSAFLATLASEFAKDTYKKAKELVSQLGRARRMKPGAIWLQDDHHNFVVVLEPDLPDAAYLALVEMDLAPFLDGVLSWDRAKGAWNVAARERGKLVNSVTGAVTVAKTIRIPLDMPTAERERTLAGLLEEGWTVKGSENGTDATYIDLERTTKG